LKSPYGLVFYHIGSIAISICYSVRRLFTEPICIIAQLIIHKDSDEGAARQPHGKTQDVDDRKDLVFPETLKASLKKIFIMLNSLFGP
jgi:hypothetical protein